MFRASASICARTGQTSCRYSMRETRLSHGGLGMLGLNWPSARRTCVFGPAKRGVRVACPFAYLSTTGVVESTPRSCITQAARCCLASRWRDLATCRQDLATCRQDLATLPSGCSIRRQFHTVLQPRRIQPTLRRTRCRIGSCSSPNPRCTPRFPNGSGRARPICRLRRLPRRLRHRRRLPRSHRHRCTPWLQKQELSTTPKHPSSFTSPKGTLGF